MPAGNILGVMGLRSRGVRSGLNLSPNVFVSLSSSESVQWVDSVICRVADKGDLEPTCFEYGRDLKFFFLPIHG